MDELVSVSNNTKSIQIENGSDIEVQSLSSCSDIKRTYIQSNEVDIHDHHGFLKQHRMKQNTRSFQCIKEIHKLEEFSILSERLAEDCKCIRQVPSSDEDSMYESVVYALSKCPECSQNFGELTSEMLRKFVVSYILENPSNPDFNAYIGQTVESRERYCHEILKYKKWGNVEIDLMALSMVLEVKIFVHMIDFFTDDYSIKMLGFEDFSMEICITFQAKSRRFNVVEDIIL